MTTLFMLMAFLGSNKSADFAPLPEDIWTIGTNAQKKMYDAAIYLDEHKIHPKVIHRYRVVRIFSEDGRGAADFSDTYGSAKNLHGRVVTRDGKIIPFNDKEDLIEILAAKQRRKKVKARLLLPPGITRDCVVEMRWDIKAELGLPEGYYSVRRDAAEDYYVHKKTFFVDGKLTEAKETFTFKQKFQLAMTKGREPIVFAQSEAEGGMLYTWSNIPPRKYFPYGNAYLDGADPYFRTRKVPYWTNTSDPNAFWHNAAQAYIIPALQERVGKNRDFKNFVKQLKANMPKDPIAASQHIAKNLQNRLRDLEMLRPDQVSGYKDPENWDNTFGQILDKSFKDGYASRSAQAYLFYFVAMECEIPFKLLYPGSMDGPFFDPKLCYTGHLDFQSPYFLVQTDNAMQIFAPQFRDYAFGVIPSKHKGAYAMTLDPYNDFAVGFMRVPQDQAALHMVRAQYQMNLDTNDQLTMLLTNLWGGEEEAGKRRFYFTRTLVEQKEYLEKSYGSVLRDWQVEEAQLVDPYNLEQQLTMQLSARRQLEDFGTGILRLDPFPASFSPLSNPDLWPDQRSQPIILPNAFQALDEAMVQLPPGYTLRGDNNWQQKNNFGQVAFQAFQKEDKVFVRRTVVLARNIEQATNEVQLKLFLGWVENAYNQNIALVKGDAQ